DLLSRDGMPLAFVEQAQELHFVKRKRLGAITVFHGVGSEVDLELSDLRTRGLAWATGPAKRRANARGQLADAEGLGDVVVGPGIAPPDLVRFEGARRQNDDGHVRIRFADLLT